MFGLAGLKARGKIGLVVPDVVVRDPRTHLAVDRGRIVIGKSRRRGHRIAPGITIAKLVPDSYIVVKVMLEAKSGEVRTQFLFISTKETIKGVARDGGRPVAEGNQHVVGHGYPGH